MPQDAKNRTFPRALAAALPAALALRLVLAALTPGYPYDYSCFLAWGERMLTAGPGHFYAPNYFADYPPGYLWVLAGAAALRRLLGAGYEDALSRVLLVLFPALCDTAAAALVWRAGQRFCPQRPRLTLCVALFTAFSPLLLYDTAVWKQIDGAFALPLLLCFLLLEEKRYLPAAVFYGLALAVKPQALLAGPVLAVCFLAGIADAVPAGPAAVCRAVGRIFGGAALALAPPVLLALPFYGARVLPELLEKYRSTAGGYPYASVNAFNWLAALGGNWQPLTNAGLGPLSWQALGIAGIIAVTALLAVLAVHSWRAGRFSPLLLAAFYVTGIFTFAHCMHERYLVLGALLALLAAARAGDERVYLAGFGFSFAGFFDLAAIYTLVGTEDEWLTSAASDLFARVVGLAETFLFVYFALVVWEWAEGTASAAAPARALRLPPRPAAAPQPRWQRRELAAMAALTLATAAVSFWNLGDLTAPQNPVDANGGSYAMTVTLLPHPSPLAEIWVYPGISSTNSGHLSVTDAAGAAVLDLTLDHGTAFNWRRFDARAAGPGPYTVTVTGGQIFEMCFRDAAGEISPLENLCYQDPLFDEQALVPDAISYRNGFYFDEIYHARTGYEELHAMPIYETTHPPLGKDLIMLGIALFGMTGFGWRFSGTLFGVLLVPLAWCFARRLTRRRWAGALAGVLLAFDFMRFAQSRIATIDTYATFFILAGALCMLWYCQRVLERGVGGALLPMALGGLCFGLGCAAKWTGIYAGAGLAVLYLGVLWARWQQKPPEFRRELCAAALGGVVFYILLPLCIYAVSYLPYTWRSPTFGLRELWQAQVTMFNYHTGLTGTHGFESRWYTWLLGLRPVWYYNNTNLPAGLHGTIAGLGGPVIWLGGLAALFMLLWRQASGRGTRAGAGVLILYAAQLLPWLLVTRSTFLYHYFPSSQFCLMALVLVLARLPDERRAKRLGAGLCAASAVLFALYYPVLSGITVPQWWADALRILPSFGF